MNQSIITASVSMSGMQRKIDVISDNVANLDTYGYKRKTASFADVLTNVTGQHNHFEQPGRATPLGFTNAYGMRMTGTMRDFSMGEINPTDVPTDFALIGEGLFEVASPEGTAFVREGNFQLIPAEGGEALLATQFGAPVQGMLDGAPVDFRIDVKKGFQMQVDEQGRVFEVKSSTGEQYYLGSLRIVRPTKPELLLQVDDNRYVIPEGIDRNSVVQELNLTEAAADGIVPLKVRQGALETSNVSLIDEMSELIQAQRAYQMASRALSSADQMWGLANSIRG
ncbi:flagellar hook-basal body protein [Paenibacillus aquistagni]|uniref:Flagellar basal-body rod protein FlgG n=1 Tax=Paenibacillus aquistagni TaxID=1852522 RepID=A0A1X7KX52_9BACL|nr:flagellar hook-basal body protein [Paenibacillus aquistagni]SMG45804.1 flagellar basal-body rod protein FlgG [Paenibacillus aquistagni]